MSQPVWWSVHVPIISVGGKRPSLLLRAYVQRQVSQPDNLVHPAKSIQRACQGLPAIANFTFARALALLDTSHSLFGVFRRAGPLWPTPHSTHPPLHPSSSEVAQATSLFTLPANVTRISSLLGTRSRETLFNNVCPSHVSCAEYGQRQPGGSYDAFPEYV